MLVSLNSEDAPGAESQTLRGCQTACHWLGRGQCRQFCKTENRKTVTWIQRLLSEGAAAAWEKPREVLYIEQKAHSLLQPSSLWNAPWW